MCARCVGARDEVWCATCYIGGFDMGNGSRRQRCYMCRDKQARLDHRGRYCKTCYPKMLCILDETILRDEYVARRSKTAGDATPTGLEPALQLLIWPAIHKPPLPSYDNEPSFIAPDHCRTCLQVACPGHDAQEHRRDILERVAAEGVSPVSSQVARSRLTALKDHLCHDNYAEGVCACCARSKKRSTLQKCDFAHASASEPPAWLRWDVATWLQHGQTWWEQVDSILNIEVYLQEYLHADERVDQAVADRDEARKVAAREPNSEEAQEILRSNIVWATRVTDWRAHLRTDLIADSVPAPGASVRRWLLYSGGMLTPTSLGTLSCNLCRSCRSALSNANSAGEPSVRMPPYARARGMWNGPEPAAIHALTRVERAVLRLARVYQVIKRISAHIAPYASGNADALPQYTTGNTVAYAQDPEAISRCLCLTPQQLADDLFIQFEGPKDEAFTNNAQAIQVSVQRLRAALHFFLTHNWQWLEMTRGHDIVSSDNLGEHFESLLEAYRESVGGADTGIPRELFARADPLSEDLIDVHYDGPADATAGADSESDSPGCPGTLDAAGPSEKKQTAKACDSSSAILDTGLDVQSPLRLWNLAMDRYRVLQKLEDQWENADSGHARDEVVRQETMALRDAVVALHKLRAAEATRKLEEYRQWLEGENYKVPIHHASIRLNSFSPNWWVYCFTDLFFFAETSR